MKKTSAATITIVLLGNLLYAFGVKFFLLPAGLPTGGTTGIALILNHYWEIPISAFVLGFNLLMLLIGWKVLGSSFALTTILSTFTYPVFLEAFERIFPDVVLTTDLFLFPSFPVFVSVSPSASSSKAVPRPEEWTSRPLFCTTTGEYRFLFPSIFSILLSFFCRPYKTP